MTTPQMTRSAGSARLVWRTRAVVVPVVLANAIVQGLLAVAAPAVAGRAVLSVVAASAGFGLVASAMLAAIDAHGASRTWAAAVGGLRSHVIRFAAWTAGWVLALGVGYSLWVVPAIVIAVLTPYVPLAALDGRPNPIAANARAIADRPGRWVVLLLVTAFSGFVCFVAFALVTFFVRGFLAAVIVWVVGGLVSAWLTALWCNAFRGAQPEAGPDQRQ